MKKIVGVVSILMIVMLSLSGCGEDNSTSSYISEVSVTVSENSEKETHKAEKTSEAEKSESESSKESSVQSSEEKSEESSEDESGEVSQTESSEEESSESSVEQSEEMSEELSSEPEKIIDKSVVYGFDKKYFVSRLDESMLKAFLQMYDAVENFEMTVRFIEAVPSDDLDTLMFLLNYDCPELIQLNGDYSPIYTDESEENTSGVYFTYNMSENDYQNHTDELHLFFENLKADTNNMDELQKEKYVYDMIFDECVYDDTDAYSGTVWGTLVNHIGRCEGICKSFMWCMRELDIECMCVSGIPKWEADAVYSGHSWNIIKINDQYYQLDLTIDNIREYFSDENHANYGFFNVNDEFNNKTHKIYDFYQKLGVPACESEDMNYHKMNHLFVYADGDVQEQVKTILENHFSDGIIDNVSLKFESLGALNKADAGLESWLKEFFEEKEISSYEHNSEYDTICQTITVYAKGTAENGDE